MEQTADIRASVGTRLGEIVKTRRDHLQAVRKDIERWTQLDASLDELTSVQQSLREKASLPGELHTVLQMLDTAPMRLQVVQALDALRVAETRFARETLNIGVTGRARVGKSTLLQSISGLGEPQLPTGSGEPVTAVRSRIVHGPTTRAVLTFHSEPSFMQEVVGPYFTAIGQPSRPETLEEFRRWSDFGAPDAHSAQELLKRLRRMQLAVASYERELTGGEREIPIDELRAYVAYPTKSDRDQRGDAVERKYLAVRDARIETPFPHAAVDRVGIVDLPGLGEVAAKAQEHHVDGLRDTVDIVVLVKRPLEGLAYWGREDTTTVDLMDQARGDVRSRRDFVAVLANRGPDDDPHLIETLRDGIPTGPDGDKHFIPLEANALDPEEVATNVIWPLLEHLAARLPVMDGDVLNAAREKTTAIVDSLARDLGDVQSTLGDLRVTLGSTAEALDKGAEELQKDVAAGLAGLVAELRQVAEHEPSDAQYIAQVNAAHDEVKAWIDSGFGVGGERWEHDALRTMRVSGTAAAWIGPQLNAVRIHISRRYAGVDDALRLRVEELQRQVADVLKEHLDGLIAPDLEGVDALRALHEALSYAPEPCPTLSAALDGLISLRLEYRTHIHPRIRGELNQLNLQVRNPETGKPIDQIVVEITPDGAAQAYVEVGELAEMAIHRVRKALVREAGTPALVLYAVAEQFEDEVIRSAGSEREFGRLARSYRDELWPGVYSGMDAQNAHVARFQRALQNANEVLEDYVPAR
jgi:hypothetical protein